MKTQQKYAKRIQLFTGTYRNKNAEKKLFLSLLDQKLYRVCANIAIVEHTICDCN